MQPSEETLDLLFLGPTFDVLKRNEGTLETDILRKELGHILSGLLSVADWEPYPSEKEKNTSKWWTDIRAQAIRWRTRGLILGTTHDAIWRISETGLRELESHRALFLERGHIKPQIVWEFTAVGEDWWARKREGKPIQEDIFGY
jgi:hypothetical protein